MATGNRRVRVLLVAEPGEFMGRLRARLRAEGCSVQTARTADAALTAARKRFDLILLDLQLPDGRSLSALRHLRGQENSVATPIFLLKDEGEPPHVVQRGLDLGASGFVSKRRLPANLGWTSITDNLILASSLLEVYEAGRPTPPAGRPDTCAFSSRREFGRCRVFLPIRSGAHQAPDSEAMVSCSHLRVGTCDTWLLYPRCAIGDQTARDRYMEEKTAV